MSHTTKNQNIIIDWGLQQTIYLASCRDVVQAGGPGFRYYRVIPLRWGVVSSVLFTKVPVSNKLIQI